MVLPFQTVTSQLTKKQTTTELPQLILHVKPHLTATLEFKAHQLAIPQTVRIDHPLSIRHTMKDTSLFLATVIFKKLDQFPQTATS
jgi:hypothetical protein